MNKITAKSIVAWLKVTLGDHDTKLNRAYWIEDSFAHGDTIGGFYPEYTINYEKLEENMDAWIAETFAEDRTDMDQNKAPVFRLSNDTTIGELLRKLSDGDVTLADLKALVEIMESFESSV